MSLTKYGFIFFLTLSIFLSQPCLALNKVRNFKELAVFNFEELNTLSKDETLEPELEKKLDQALNSVILRSEPLNSNSLHHNEDINKDYLRITHWNIQRGLNIDTILDVLSGKAPSDLNTRAYKPGDKRYDKVFEEAKLLETTDVLLLNEVDMGMDRTDYREVATEIADKLGAAYVYAPEFIEVEPRVLKQEDIDQNRYKGFHGNAIISKYPIESTRLIHLPACYDWIDSEDNMVFPLEVWKRIGLGVVFDEVIHREIRRGNRIALTADLKLPNGEIITVVGTHLENKTTPQCRLAQVEHILSEISHIKNPIVFGGDLNSFEVDTSPTNTLRAVKNKATDIGFLARLANSIANPLAIFINPPIVATSLFRKYRNPTVLHVPILFPNRVYPLFKTIKTFNFDDGTKFLYQKENDPQYLYGRKGELATTNHRVVKGYKSTFSMKRDYYLARFKYDWFFVKPDAKFNEEGHTVGERNYFPAFARTLHDLNHCRSSGKISDHSPITLDLII